MKSKLQGEKTKKLIGFSVVEIDGNQFLTAYRELAKECGCSTASLGQTMALFKKHELLDYQTIGKGPNKKTLITVL